MHPSQDIGEQEHFMSIYVKLFRLRLALRGVLFQLYLNSRKDHLEVADPSFLNLSQTNLRGANLRNANLIRAELSSSNSSEADLAAPS
jgi:uncharacterized protein YjbI with pentapeptide repeats